MLYFAFVDYRRGYALAFSLVLINLAADIVYVIFPVTTDIYRSELLAHPLTGNFFAQAMYAHYAADPSFNCLPSLHAAVATICAYAWYRYARLHPGRVTQLIAVAMFVEAAAVVLSTLFVKQHYIADELAGIALAWAVGRWLFDAFWSPRPRRARL
jgi:membrane-associated phospholipid phosphatase